MHDLGLIIEIYESKLRDVLGNEWPVIFDIVKVMEVEEQPRNQNRWRDGQMERPSVTCGPGLELFAAKDI